MGALGGASGDVVSNLNLIYVELKLPGSLCSVISLRNTIILVLVLPTVGFGCVLNEPFFFPIVLQGPPERRMR